jgi:hypothetical protein
MLGNQLDQQRGLRIRLGALLFPILEGAGLVLR